MPAMIKIKPRMPMMARNVIEVLSSCFCVFSLGFVLGLSFGFCLGLVKATQIKVAKVQ